MSDSMRTVDDDEAIWGAATAVMRELSHLPMGHPARDGFRVLLERASSQVPKRECGNVIPLRQAMEFPKQEDRREFVWMALEGQPKIRQRKLILESHAVGLLDDGDTRAFLDAAGVSV